MCIYCVMVLFYRWKIQIWKTFTSKCSWPMNLHHQSASANLLVGKFIFRFQIILRNTLAVVLRFRLSLDLVFTSNTLVQKYQYLFHVSFCSNFRIDLYMRTASFWIPHGIGCYVKFFKMKFWFIVIVDFLFNL